MRSALTFALASILAASGTLAGEAVTFTAKPTVTKAGDPSTGSGPGKYKIAFAVSAPTDVAVYIEDARGEVIRHLVAGALGQNPPAPLKPGLSQELEWDGKADYGDLPPSTIHPPPFRVRVGLGLGARYDRVAFTMLPDLRYAATFATAPDGRLYVSFGGMRWKAARSRWRVFNRDGTFQSTHGVAPGVETAKYFGWDADAYHPDPRRYQQTGFATGEGMLYDIAVSDAVAVGRDGADLFQLGEASPVRINRYPLTASCPKDDKFSVSLDGSGAVGVADRQGCLAVASDGKSLYVGGLEAGDKKAKKPLAAVWAVKCPERTGCRVFFGDPAKPGKDDKSLGGAPAGLAVDGKGRLFIADEANNRVVVVDEKDGKYLGEIGVDKPVRLGFSARVGALYVLAMAGKALTLQRFNLPAGADPKGWKALKPGATMSVVPKYTRSFALAVDDSASPAVVWAGGGWNPTLRIEDSGTGAKFGAVKDFSAEGLSFEKGMQDNIPCADVEVDRLRKEVYFRVGGNGNYYGRFIEKTGATEFIGLPAATLWGGAGIQACPAPNGNIYGLVWQRNFYQWDRQGKPVSWEDPPHFQADWVLDTFTYHDKSFTKAKIPRAGYVPVSMSGLPHMLGVRWSDGHIFVLHPPSAAGGARRSKAMHEYAPSGKWVTALDSPIIWKVSDAATGPKFDAAGNIYIAEAIRPEGWVLPPELAADFEKRGLSTKLGQDGKAAGPVGVTTSMYGSIVKFGPRGGTVEFTDAPKWANYATGEPYTGQPKLDPGLKSLNADWYWGGVHKTKVIGAEWVHPGFGHAGFYKCNCESVTFDVDEFGRTFFPDPLTFQVRVIDTAGNALTRFGGFGTENCMGPESPVVDPKTDRLRPRRADDPKDMKSPFAEPELGFQWLVGVGVTDRYGYFGDSLNQRLLRAKLVYAAEETVTVP